MMEAFYRFAGLELTVSMPENMMYTDPFRLTPFAVETVTDPHRFAFRREVHLPSPRGGCLNRGSNVLRYQDSEGDIAYVGASEGHWETACARVEHRGKDHRVLVRQDSFPGRINASVALEMLNLEHLTVCNQSVILHAAFLEWEGKAILFTAPSGTGKSTQAALWQRHRGARILNGDRAVIRLEGNRILAEGVPFCGSSGISENASLPLLAVVYLGQAPVSSIRRLRGYEAFARLWEGCVSDVWTGEEREKASETLETLASRVPVYHMPCTPDAAAVDLLEKTLRKQERQ